MSVRILTYSKPSLQALTSEALPKNAWRKELWMRIAMALLVFLAPFAAHASRFTLADANGVPSCQFVILLVKQKLDYGLFYSQNCDPPGPTLAGSGVSTRIDGSPAQVWSFSLTGPSTGTSLYFFNIKALTWVEYYENGDAPLTLVGSGILLKGGHTTRQRSLGSTPAK